MQVLEKGVAKRGKADEKVGIVVDECNMYYGAKETYGFGVDYEALLRAIRRDRPMAGRARLVTVWTPDMGGFKKKMEKMGFEVVAVRSKKSPDGSLKNLTDDYVKLAINEFANDGVSTIALASGDKHFEPELRDAKYLGKSIEVYAVPGSLSWELYGVADKLGYVGEDVLRRQ